MALGGLKQGPLNEFISIGKFGFVVPQQRKTADQENCRDPKEVLSFHNES